MRSDNGRLSATILRAGASVSSVLGRDSRMVRVLRPLYESLLDVIFLGRGVPWVINGVAYRVDPHFRDRFGHTYDVPVAEFLRERVKPGDLCFDVGANVGVYVLQFAQWSAPNGRVIAFEPNPRTREALLRHTALNHLTGRVEIVPAAVAAASGTATLYAAGSDGMSRLGAPNVLLESRTAEISVSVVTLDEFCLDRNLYPRWLLVDIEGFEIAALRGARQLITRRGPDLGIVVEMHPNVWHSAGTDRRDVEAVLSELGRRPRGLTGQSDPLGEHGLVFLEPV
jgi:FkbM family methyltransferase